MRNEFEFVSRKNGKITMSQTELVSLVEDVYSATMLGKNIKITITPEGLEPNKVEKR